MFLCVSFWGEPLQLVQDGKILPAPPGLLPFQGVSRSGSILLQELGHSGSLHLRVEVDFWGYTVSSLLLVARVYCLYVCVCWYLPGPAAMSLLSNGLACDATR